MRISIMQYSHKVDLTACVRIPRLEGYGIVKNVSLCKITSTAVHVQTHVPPESVAINMKL